MLHPIKFYLQSLIHSLRAQLKQSTSSAEAEDAVIELEGDSGVDESREKSSHLQATPQHASSTGDNQCDDSRP